MIRMARLCEEVDVTYRQLYHAATRLRLIEAHGDNGPGHQWVLTDTEAERVRTAVRIAHEYDVDLPTVLQWQLDGRIENEDGRLLLAPVS